MKRYAEIMRLVGSLLPVQFHRSGTSMVCVTLTDLMLQSHITRDEKITLTRWVHSQLCGHGSYEQWLKAQHPRYLTITPRQLLEGRMQWVSAMVKQLEVWS